MTGPAAPRSPLPGRPDPPAAFPWRPGRPVPECQALTGWHSLTRARLYPAGWLCDRHRPGSHAHRPDPPQPPAGDARPGPAHVPTDD